MVPQYSSPLAVEQVSGWQPEPGPALHRLFWHVHPVLVHVLPQGSVDPQPSPISPQYWSLLAVVQDSGTQPAVGPALHRLPWQIHPGLLQVDTQLRVEPHPSPMSPQY